MFDFFYLTFLTDETPSTCEDGVVSVGVVVDGAGVLVLRADDNAPGDAVVGKGCPMQV